MNDPDSLIPPRLDLWPARFDILQSSSGLILGLFMWLHMFFVASILLGKDAMWTVARFFEGYFFFGRSLPWLVSLFVAAVFWLLVAHALLAVVIVTWLAARYFFKHIGGYTGDCLGAVQQVAELAFYFGLLCNFT